MKKATPTNVEAGTIVRALPGHLGRRAGRTAVVLDPGPKRIVIRWETGAGPLRYHYHHFEVQPTPTLEVGFRVYNTVVKSYGVITGFSLMGLVQVLYDSGQPGEAHPENLKVVHAKG